MPKWIDLWFGHTLSPLETNMPWKAFLHVDIQRNGDTSPRTIINEFGVGEENTAVSRGSYSSVEPGRDLVHIKTHVLCLIKVNK